MSPQSSDTYAFFLNTYETEILKTITIWSAFPESSMPFRPAPKSRSVMEQMDHQLQSEARWMASMFGIDTGDPNPADRTKRAFIDKYQADAGRRLEALRHRPESWWHEKTAFFDVTRTRAWIFLRRLSHSAHHRGQLIVYLRLLGVPVPSVYGPTADTGDKVLYKL